MLAGCRYLLTSLHPPQHRPDRRRSPTDACARPLCRGRPAGCGSVAGEVLHTRQRTPVMDSQQIRTTFTDFYSTRGHGLVRGSTLMPPEGDDSVLFTTSGMHPLTPYLQGRPHPKGERLVNVQRCLRTSDLDSVGDSTHLTTFQMLGSWSLGNYTHSQSLRWGYELLCEGFGIDPSRMYVTVFGGDGWVGRDEESRRVWSELEVPVELLVEDNWWSNGPTGPCG